MPETRTFCIAFTSSSTLSVASATTTRIVSKSMACAGAEDFWVFQFLFATI
jgi:hypothetical protein